MSILDAAKRRYSAKAFDPSRKISDADIQTLKTIFQLSPSSINIQPWHVLITDSEAGKKQVAQATQGDFIFNEQKVLDASHVMVLCVRNDVDQKYLDRMLAKEQADGRISNEKVFNTTKTLYSGYLAGVRANPEFFKAWTEHQVYIALGGLLSEVLHLKEKALTPIALVALGYHTDDDFNARLPKSRFELDEIFTHF